MANPVSEKPRGVTKKVTTGVRKESGFVRKMANILLAENLDDAKNRIFYDLLVPTLKRTVVSAVETIVWGGASPRNQQGYTGGTYRYYNNYSQPQSNQTNRYPTREVYDCGTISVPSVGEAELVIDQLVENINQYGATSVADLCEACDIPTQPTDNAYGWTDLRNARVIPTADGAVIKLPKAVPLRR